jgi:NAD(P)-dependent dehydrogenase (short-subunit alcohol dehydrogenase family)
MISAMSGGQFAGLRVVVTGGASGIGRATATAFARGGAELILCDLDRVGLQRTAQLCEDRGGKAIFTDVVDVSNRDQMSRFYEGAMRAAGGVDVLVNNAGIGAAGAFVATDLATWDRVMAVNLMGTVHGCHLFLPHMLERGHGHIVNIASILGLVGFPGVAPYAASKYAVVGFTRGLLCELKDSGVAVTAICPGLIATDIMTNAALSHDVAPRRERIAATFRKGSPPELVARAIVDCVSKRKSGLVPVTRFARVAHLVERVAPRVSTYITTLSQTRFRKSAEKRHKSRAAG